MFKKISITVIIIFYSCQHPMDIAVFPNPGTARVTIDGTEFSGTASVSSEQRGHFYYDIIRLSLNDSTIIEIQHDGFKRGFISCDPESGSEVLFIVTLQNNPFYYANKGGIELKDVNTSYIKGEFNVVIFNPASSCMECPGTLKKCEGIFNAMAI